MLNIKPSVLYLGKIPEVEYVDHKFNGKFRNMHLSPITLTTVLGIESVDNHQLYLYESGVKGTMDMMVLGKQLSFPGSLVSQTDFLLETKNFLSVAIQMFKKGEDKDILKILMSYFAFYNNVYGVNELFKSHPERVPEDIGSKY